MAAANRVDMTGLRVNKLLCLRAIKKPNQPKKVYWECLCDCGETIVVDASCLRRKDAQQSCGCDKPQKLQAMMWRGYEEISGCYWNRLKRNAVRYGREFNISIEQGWDLYEKQGRACGLTGVPIGFTSCVKRRKEEQTASLDRIDSSRGYTLDNIMWVHKAVNRLKTNLTNQEFVALCCMVSDYHRRGIS